MLETPLSQTELVGGEEELMGLQMTRLWIDTRFDMNDLRAGCHSLAWGYACLGCSDCCRDISAIEYLSTRTVGNHYGCAYGGRRVIIANL